MELNSPADEAGIERGSVITAVDFKEIESTGDLLAALREYRAGDRIVLTIVESGEERQVMVDLEERSQ